MRIGIVEEELEDKWKNKDVERWMSEGVEAVFSYLHKKDPEDMYISVLCGNDEMIQGLNRTFRGIDKPTNVLSFPMFSKEDKGYSDGYYNGDCNGECEEEYDEEYDEDDELTAEDLIELFNMREVETNSEYKERLDDGYNYEEDESKLDKEDVDCNCSISDNACVCECKCHCHDEELENNLEEDNAEAEYTEPEDVLGCIAFSYETIEREAAEQGKTFENHMKHLIVHSILHLLGYDHITEDDATEMENLEIKILETIGISDPYEEQV